MAAELRAGGDLVVGVTKLAWMYGRSRDWAERLLKEWHEKQLNGGPVRVFAQGKRGSLFTTLPVVHQHMPPGRDLVLYRRMDAVEADVSTAHSRIDREIAERKRDVGDIGKRVMQLESSVGRRSTPAPAGA